MKRKKFFIITTALIFFHLFANPLQSCVGRVLILALSDSPDQEVVGTLMATLITERTGTAVEIIKPGNEEAVHKAVIDGKAQIYINYLNTGKAHTTDVGDITDDNELYVQVRQNYLDKFNFVMLKPFGYKGPSEADGSITFPVTTKETIKGFPVLDRVINKLGGKITNEVVKELSEQAKTDEIKKVVKKYLKDHKMI